VHDYKEHCLRCLQSPQTKAESQLSEQLKKQIKVRIRDVLARADAKGLRMEIPEARHIAQDEVIAIFVEIEKERATKQMDVDDGN